jgi:hypothetical protein
LAEEEQQSAALEQAKQARSPKDYLSALLNREAVPRPEKASLREPAPLYHTSRLQTPLMPEESELPEARLAGRLPPADSTPCAGRVLPLQSAETWQQWELAPGVELHVRAGAAKRYRTLIERLLRMAAVTRDW